MQNRILPLVASALALAAQLAAADAPLKVEVPKPLFAGTPRPISLANLEPANAKRPDIMVSSDVKLLSKGKKVTSSEIGRAHV